MLKKIFLLVLFFCSIANFSNVAAENETISISNVTVSNITHNSAIITWTSTIAGDSEIRYSNVSKELTNFAWNKAEFSSDGSTSHVINLKGLKANTTYFFEVKTANANIGEAVSSTGTFNTLIEEKPDLIITDIYFYPNTPTAGQQFSGEVRVKVKNQGTGAAINSAQGIPVIITIADAKTGANSDWANAGFYYIDNLAANAVAEAKFPVKYTTFNSEILRLRAWVDSNALNDNLSDNLYILNEVDENNNFFKKDIVLGESTENLLSLELDKIALNAGEIENGFILTHLTYNASDVSSSNNGISQPSESISQVYQSKNVRTDRQSFSATLRTHKTIADARKHFEVTNTNHVRQIISLSAANKEIFADDIFCHTTPASSNFTSINHKEGQPDIYYLICGFRYKNIFIDLQAELNSNDYQIPLRNLRQYFDNIINYDSTRKPPLPGSTITGTSQLNSSAETSKPQVTTPINCAQDNKPACGVNGKTYSSRCEAEKQNNAKVAYEGKCVSGGAVEPSHVETLVLNLKRAVSELEQKVTELEKRLVAVIDQGLVKRVKGKILLQVEGNGEAWYVDPQSENKLYMKDGLAAYDIMKALGLGISNVNLEKIPIGLQEKLFNLTDTDSDNIPDKTEEAVGTNPNKADSDGDGVDDKTEILGGYKPGEGKKYSYDSALINKLKGRILLQVESKGEAWYINPTDGKRYYLGDPGTAYNVMKFLSLGIKNNDLRKIQVGEFEEK